MTEATAARVNHNPDGIIATMAYLDEVIATPQRAQLIDPHRFQNHLANAGQWQINRYLLWGSVGIEAQRDVFDDGLINLSRVRLHLIFVVFGFISTHPTANIKAHELWHDHIRGCADTANRHGVTAMRIGHQCRVGHWWIVQYIGKLLLCGRIQQLRINLVGFAAGFQRFVINLCKAQRT